LAASGKFAKSDEAKHLEEMRAKAEEKKKKEMEAAREMLTRGGRAADMKEQAMLKAELEHAYKTGNQEAIKKLKRKLEADDDRGRRR